MDGGLGAGQSCTADCWHCVLNRLEAYKAGDLPIGNLSPAASGSRLLHHTAGGGISNKGRGILAVAPTRSRSRQL